MTKDQYLRMIEQTGEEIDWDRSPPDVEDFPPIVLDCLNIFNSLGNRMYPEIGYVGKDYTTLSFLCKVYGIQRHQMDYVIDLLLWLDSRMIEDSQKKLSAAHDKIKRS